MGVAMYHLCNDFSNLNVIQGVITAKSFQDTIYNWSGIPNLHVLKNVFFRENVYFRV